VGALEASSPAERCRDPQRPGRITPGGQRHHACRHCGRRAGRRATGRQVAVPGVARVIPPVPAHAWHTAAGSGRVDVPSRTAPAATSRPTTGLASEVPALARNGTPASTPRRPVERPHPAQPPVEEPGNFFERVKRPLMIFIVPQPESVLRQHGFKRESVLIASPGCQRTLTHKQTRGTLKTMPARLDSQGL
jgi:hypothetical protein